jgi:hypothetical protein
MTFPALPEDMLDDWMVPVARGGRVPVSSPLRSPGLFFRETLPLKTNRWDIEVYQSLDGTTIVLVVNGYYAFPKTKMMYDTVTRLYDAAPKPASWRSDRRKDRADIVRNLKDEE